jgi:hypothetical protein
MIAGSLEGRHAVIHPSKVTMDGPPHRWRRVNGAAEQILRHPISEVLCALSVAFKIYADTLLKIDMS